MVISRTPHVTFLMQSNNITPRITAIYTHIKQDMAKIHTAARSYGMAPYPTQHIYDDDFIIISIDINDYTWFVALNYVFFVPNLVLYAYKWQ